MTKMSQKLMEAANALFTPEEQEQLAVRKLALMANDPTGGHAASPARAAHAAWRSPTARPRR